MFPLTTNYTGTPPVPVADSKKLARVKELQAKIQLRRAEIEDLRQRRSQLVDIAAVRGENRVASQDALIGSQLLVGSSLQKTKRIQQRLQEESFGQHQGANSPARSDPHSPRRANTKPLDNDSVRIAMADPSNPLNLPIVSFVQDSATPKSFDIFDVAPDQVGDIVMEIDVALAAFNHSITRVKKETHEFEFQTAQSNKRLGRLIEQQQLFEEITGMPPEGPVTSCVDSKSKSRREDALNRSTAPAYQMHRSCEEANPESPSFNASGTIDPDDQQSPGQRTSRENKSLNARLLLVAKEIRDAQVVIAKKQQTIRDLEKTIKKQTALERATLDIYNTIRVKDREVREQKIVLEKLMTEHESIDARLRKMQAIEAVSVENKMLENVAAIKQQVAYGAAEEQQVHQRVIKVQEFRLAQLQRRLRIISDALASHHLRDDVEVMISEALELQHRQNEGPGNSQFGSGGSPNSSAASPSRPRGRERAVGGASRVPTKASTSSLSPARSQYADPISMEVASLSEDELFDVDLIVPPNERVHPAIYSLLISEKERLDKKVGLQRILIAEKGAAMEMTKGKLEHVHITYDEAVKTQRRTAAMARISEEEHKAALVERVADNRDLLQSLKGEHCELKRSQRKRLEATKSQGTPFPIKSS
jgi:hypothetical protein